MATEITGIFMPEVFEDADAPVNSIYYSSTSSVLVYKDWVGDVHPLYSIE